MPLGGVMPTTREWPMHDEPQDMIHVCREDVHVLYDISGGCWVLSSLSLSLSRLSFPLILVCATCRSLQGGNSAKRLLLSGWHLRMEYQYNVGDL